MNNVLVFLGTAFIDSHKQTQQDKENKTQKSPSQKGNSEAYNELGALFHQSYTENNIQEEDYQENINLNQVIISEHFNSKLAMQEITAHQRHIKKISKILMQKILYYKPLHALLKKFSKYNVNIKSNVIKEN